MKKVEVSRQDEGQINDIVEDFSDNEAFALNDKDDLFLSELGNILLEEEKLSDQWEDHNGDEDIKMILASCEKNEEGKGKKQNSQRGSPNMKVVDISR